MSGRRAAKTSRSRRRQFGLAAAAVGLRLPFRAAALQGFPGSCRRQARLTSLPQLQCKLRALRIGSILTLKTTTMADTTGAPGAGGFIPPKSLPSPAPSGTSTRSASGLPHPRAHPLRAGSAKEEKIRIYVENQLMYISRRFVKKFEAPRSGDDVVGYKNVAELCKDIEALMDIIWLSGTREHYT